MLYEAAMRNVPTRLETMLTEIYLPPKQTALNDPRYQMLYPNRFFPDEGLPVEKIQHDPYFAVIPAARVAANDAFSVLEKIKINYNGLHPKLRSDISRVDAIYGQLFGQALFAHGIIYFPIANGDYFNRIGAEILGGQGKAGEVSVSRSELRRKGGKLAEPIPLNGNVLEIYRIPSSVIPVDAVGATPSAELRQEPQAAGRFEPASAEPVSVDQIISDLIDEVDWFRSMEDTFRGLKWNDLSSGERLAGVDFWLSNKGEPNDNSLQQFV